MRFPEFKGEWKTALLGDILTFKNGLNCEAEKYGKGIKSISVSDVLQLEPITYSSVRNSVEATEQQKEEFKVSYGDVLFQRSSETPEDIGQSNVYLDQQPCVFGGFVIRGKAIKSFNPLFFKYLMKTQSARREVIKRGAGAQHYNIGQGQLSSVSIKMPTKEEQRKISAVLQLIDKRIEVQRKTIEELENTKDTLFRAIFEDAFNEKIALGDVLVESTERTTRIHEYTVLSSTVKGIFQQEEYFKRQISSQNDIGYKVLRRNQIVFSPQNLWMGNINLNETFDVGMVSPSYKVYSLCGKVSPVYMAGLLKSSRMKYEYSLCSEQGASVVRRNLDIEAFLQIAIPIPSKSAQAKAIRILSTLKSRISIETKELFDLENVKQYLLSNLLI